MSDNETAVPRETYDMVTTILVANSDANYSTMQRLLADAEADRDAAEEALVRFYGKVVEATETSTTRRLESVLSAYGIQIDNLEWRRSQRVSAQ